MAQNKFTVRIKLSPELILCSCAHDLDDNTGQENVILGHFLISLQ